MEATTRTETMSDKKKTKNEKSFDWKGTLTFVGQQAVVGLITGIAYSAGGYAFNRIVNRGRPMADVLPMKRAM